jgi:hypothetical protein
VPPTFTPPPTTTPEPATTETPVAGATSIITGTLSYQNRADNAGIKVQVLVNGAAVVELTTNADGGYQFTDVPPGSYTLVASADEHLNLVYTVTVTGDGATLNLGSGVLRAGDTDGNQAVDVVDAAAIGANFGNNVPPSPGSSDLNKDGLVNVSDLALVGSNYGLTGPMPGSP